MKLNKLNKFYIAIAFILIAASIYQTISYKSWERYNYSAVVNAPETFPVHVRAAYFLLPNDDFEIINTEDVNNFSTTWGVDFSTSNHARSQRLPEKIVLKYFSYRDDQFYSDTIALPQDKILRIFKSAEKKKQFVELSSYAGPKMGLSFVIGVANNGNVIVWLRGIYLERELCRIQLKPVIPKGDDLYHETILTKKEYLDYAFGDLSDSLKMVYKNGFEEKANYIDTLSRYIEKNTELWQYQQKNGFIHYKKKYIDYW